MSQILVYQYIIKFGKYVYIRSHSPVGFVMKPFVKSHKKLNSNASQSTDSLLIHPL